MIVGSGSAHRLPAGGLRPVRLTRHAVADLRGLVERVDRFVDGEQHGRLQ